MTNAINTIDSRSSDYTSPEGVGQNIVNKKTKSAYKAEDKVHININKEKGEIEKIIVKAQFSVKQERLSGIYQIIVYVVFVILSSFAVFFTFRPLALLVFFFGLVIGTAVLSIYNRR